MDVELPHEVELVRLHGLGAQAEDVGNLLYRIPFCQQLDNLTLTRCKDGIGFCPSLAPVEAELFHHFPQHTRAEVVSAVIDLAHRAEQFRHGGIFQDISRGACPEALHHVIFVFVHGQEDDLGCRSFLLHHPDSIEGGQPGHANVHENDVGAELTNLG